MINDESHKNEILNFHRQVLIDKRNKSKISTINGFKQSIDLGARVRNVSSSHEYNTRLFRTNQEFMINTRKNQKARALFRRAFLLIRVINALVSGKSMIEKIHISLIKFGM